MGKSIAERLAARLQETAGENLPGVIKEIFEILTVVDASSARLTAKKLMHNRNAAVRLAAFEAFDLQSDEDRRTAFDLFERERDATLKYRLLAALVETRDRLIIDRLFAKLEKGLFKRRILSELVRLCGELKVPESMPHLERMLLRKPFLGIFSDNALRVGAVASLGLLDTPEAVEVVKKALGDKSASVRKMCELVLQSRNGTGEGPNKGEKLGGL
jgi:HEAT repeat protein